MNKWAELLVGLILVLVPVVLAVQNVWTLGTASLEFLKGGLMWLVFMIGALFILLGISDLRE